RAFAGKPEIYWSDDRCARAEKRWRRLEAVLKALPSPEAAARAIDVIETLCVLNQPIAAASIPRVAVMLDRIALAFELTVDRRRPTRTSIIASRRAPRRESGQA